MSILIDEKQKRRYDIHRRSFENIDLDYVPFIRTTDFTRSSGNRSKTPHKDDRNRLIHTLSINEIWAYLNIIKQQHVVDVYEQWALPIEYTIEICSELGINHPRAKRSAKLGYESFDFLIKLDSSNDHKDLRYGSWLAIAVKPTNELLTDRVQEKLKLQEAFALLNDIEFKVLDSDQLRTVYSETLEGLYVHRCLQPFTERVYPEWLNTFRGEILFHSDMRMGDILKNVAYSVGIKPDLSLHFFKHALWCNDLKMNWDERLRLERTAQKLGVKSL